jgi:hypothetical protein
VEEAELDAVPDDLTAVVDAERAADRVPGQDAEVDQPAVLPQDAVFGVEPAELAPADGFVAIVDGP